MSQVGEKLRAARLSQNLTLTEVSEATRIKQLYLEALEEGDYHLLPGPAYVTGFIRNYASYLGLHPDDVIHDYYGERPPVIPTVKAATRVLASGHDRYNRSRVLTGLGGLVLVLAGGFAVKQYNDTYAHGVQAPLNVTPNNLGAPSPAVQQHVSPPGVRAFSVNLRAIRPVWVRVTVDNRLAFQGRLLPRMTHRRWSARHTIFVLTNNGTRLAVSYNGQPVGLAADAPGPRVDEATATGWRQVS